VSHDVFISYSSKDKLTADAVCATLESRGIRCWIAPRDILPGMDWGEAIIDAINTTRVMILIFSSNANESRQIKREVERAVSKGLPVIPLRIEDVPLSKSLEYFISSPHWLDAMTPPVEKHLNYLAETVKLLLNRAGQNVNHEEPVSHYQPQPQPNWSTYATPPPVPPAPRPEPKPDYSLLVILGMVLFSALCVVAFLLSSWSEPLRNWAKSPFSSEKKTESSAVVRNFSLNVEHSVTQSGHSGMLFHVRFQIQNAKGRSCAAMATFTKPDGTVLPAKNDSFATTNKSLACWIRFTPGYDPAQYDDLRLFMPYDQITTESGRHDYNFCLRIWETQTAVTDCITGSFYVSNS